MLISPLAGQGEIMSISDQPYIISDDNDGSKTYWYVMLHLEPRLIDKLLKMENEERAKNGLQEPFTFLIPFQFLERATPDKGKDIGIHAEEYTVPRGTRHHGKSELDEAAENNALRNLLHNFVFIKSSRNDIDKLLRCEWNRSGRLHLHYCRTRTGEPIRLTEKEMTPFIALFVERKQRFSFRPYGKDTLQQRTVHIKKGLFKDYQAEVVEVIQTEQGFKLTLGIPVFNNEFTLELYECADTDVDIPGGQIDQVLEPYFIEGMEKELLDILRRRIHRRETERTHRQDQKRLDSYSIFNYLKFDDTIKQTHFQALMLLCATLRRDKDTKAALVRELGASLQNTEAPLTDEEAFTTAVLFVATRHGALRKAAKEYCQTHEVSLQPLQQLMPLVKEIKTR